MRCFIAINIPNDVKNYFADIIKQLQKENTNRNITYIKPDNIHITLHFLGQIDNSRLQQIENIISEVAKHYTPFQITTQGISAFPHLQRPRVVFIRGIDKTQKAVSIQKNIGKKLKAIGIKVDSRPWKAHLTLARMKAPIAFHPENITVQPMQFFVKSIELMESTLKPTGAEYYIVQSFKLKNTV